MERLFKEWLNTAIQIDDNKEIECPICHLKTVKYLYIGDKETRIGFLRIWCSECLRGINLSRVIVPQNAKMIDFSEHIEFPMFKEVTP